MYTGIRELVRHYPELTGQEAEIGRVVDAIEERFRSGGKLLLCGNGGSAADCHHIAGELMKGFVDRRPVMEERKELFCRAGLSEEFYENLQEGLPAIALSGQDALSTAIINDLDPGFLYAQQIYALGSEKDILWAISTSGNAVNVKNAVLVARAIGMKTVAFTGKNGGWLAGHCDYVIKVPAEETYRVQEFHLPVYHAICRELEIRFFQKKDRG